MAIDRIRALVISSIWQGIAQSGANLSSVPQKDQEQMVNKIAENVMIAMDQSIDEAGAGKVAIENGMDEQVLWQGRPFLSMVESYLLTNERLKINTGLLSRDVENFELIRIQDIDMSRALGERILGLGDITIHGSDTSDPKITLRNIKDPEKVYEIIRRAWLEARKRHGLQFREYM
jgi:hypothetical protein